MENIEFIKFLEERQEEMRRAMEETLRAVEKFRIEFTHKTMMPFNLVRKHVTTGNDRDMTEVYELIPDREVTVAEVKAALIHANGVKEDDIRISGVRYFTGNQDALTLKVARITQVGSWGRYTYTIYATYDK